MLAQSNVLRAVDGQCVAFFFRFDLRCKPLRQTFGQQGNSFLEFFVLAFQRQRHVNLATLPLEFHRSGRNGVKWLRCTRCRDAENAVHPTDRKHNLWSSGTHHGRRVHEAGIRTTTDGRRPDQPNHMQITWLRMLRHTHNHAMLRRLFRNLVVEQAIARGRIVQRELNRSFESAPLTRYRKSKRPRIYGHGETDFLSVGRQAETVA